MRFFIVILLTAVPWAVSCKPRMFNSDSKTADVNPSDKPKFEGNECIRQMALWESDTDPYLSARRRFGFRFFNHYEIPLEAIKSDISEKTPPEIMKSLIFEKEGRKYVRWIEDPDDFNADVEQFAKELGQREFNSKRFGGYLGTNGSYVIDQETGTSFMVDTTTIKKGRLTNNAFGPVPTWENHKFIRRMSDFIGLGWSKSGLVQNKTTAKIFPKPMAFSIDQVRESMIVTALGEAASCDKYYLPAYAAFHQKWGTVLAGSEDPANFWNEHLIKPAARADAELWSLSGFQGTKGERSTERTYIEFDKSKKPTGKIVFHDMSNIHTNPWLHIPSSLSDAKAAGRLIASAPDSQNDYNFFFNINPMFSYRITDNNSLQTQFDKMELNVERANTWIDKEKHEKWTSSYFAEFESEMEALTGMSFRNNADSKTQTQIWLVPAVQVRGDGRFYEIKGKSQPCIHENRDSRVCGTAKRYSFVNDKDKVKKLDVYVKCVNAAFKNELDKTEGMNCPSGLLLRFKK